MQPQCGQAGDGLAGVERFIDQDIDEVFPLDFVVVAALQSFALDFVRVVAVLMSDVGSGIDPGHGAGGPRMGEHDRGQLLLRAVESR